MDKVAKRNMPQHLYPLRPPRNQEQYCFIAAKRLEVGYAVKTLALCAGASGRPKG